MKVKIKDSELEQYLKEGLMDLVGENMVNEELTNTDKKDIQSMVKKEIKDFLEINRSSQFETRVKNIVKDTFKDTVKSDKDLENKVVEISRNVLVQLYKQLWTRRAFWANDLKNAAS